MVFPSPRTSPNARIQVAARNLSRLGAVDACNDEAAGYRSRRTLHREERLAVGQPRSAHDRYRQRPRIRAVGIHNERRGLILHGTHEEHVLAVWRDPWKGAVWRRRSAGGGVCPEAKLVRLATVHDAKRQNRAMWRMGVSAVEGDRAGMTMPADDNIRRSSPWLQRRCSDAVRFCSRAVEIRGESRSSALARRRP